VQDYRLTRDENKREIDLAIVIVSVCFFLTIVLPEFIRAFIEWWP
jgi:hypothetical protein